VPLGTKTSHSEIRFAAISLKRKKELLMEKIMKGKIPKTKKKNECGEISC
jgi:hypothetical protein